MILRGLLQRLDYTVVQGCIDVTVTELVFDSRKAVPGCVFVALSGSLFTQYQGFATISMGSGAIVKGLAAIVIGDVLFGKLFKNFALKLTAVSLGAVVYFGIIQAVLDLAKIDSNYLNLSSAVVVAIFLTIPNIKTGTYKKQAKAGKEEKVC